MKRLGRHLFTLCSAMSLLLFVAVCVLWLRSYSTADYVVRSAGQDSTEFVSSRGRFLFTNETIAYPSTSELRLSAGWHRFGDAARPDNFTFLLNPPFGRTPRYAAARFGFAVRSRAAGGLTLILPDWVLALAAGVLPAVWSHARVRRCRPRREGLCMGCGYDLRATPGRCPECGTAAAAAKESSPAAPPA